MTDLSTDHPIRALHLLRNARPPLRLVDELERGNAVAFVGSGLSKLSGRPLWEELLDELRHDVEEDLPSFREFEGSATSDDFKVYADHLKTKLGSFEFYMRLRDQIAERELRDRRRENVSELHDIPRALTELVSLPFRFFVTLNYDKLIETAYRNRHGSSLPVFTARSMDPAQLRRLPREFDGQFLVKLHGDIDAPNSIVLTSGEYQGFAEDGFHETVRGFLSNHTHLFVGCSLTGDYLEDLLEERRDNPDAIRHYQLLHEPSDDIRDDRRDQRVELVSVPGAEEYETTYTAFLRRLRGFSLVRTKTTRTVLRSQRKLSRADVRQAAVEGIDELDDGREVYVIPSAPDAGYDALVAGYLWDVAECHQGAQQRPYLVWGITLDGDGSVSNYECISQDDPPREAVVLGLYPGELFELPDDVYVIEDLQYGGSSQFYRVRIVSGDGDVQASIWGDPIEIDDLDMDGELEFRCWRENWEHGPHCHRVWTPRTYRLEEGRFVDVTFESKAFGSEYLRESFPWDVADMDSDARRSILGNWTSGVREDVLQYFGDEVSSES